MSRYGKVRDKLDAAIAAMEAVRYDAALWAASYEARPRKKDTAIVQGIVLDIYRHMRDKIAELDTLIDSHGYRTKQAMMQPGETHNETK